MRFHKGGSSRAEVTLTRCRVLSACRTSETSNGSSLNPLIARLRAIHFQNPLTEGAERIPGTMARYASDSN
jgi:hypothetical protein